ncbi:MAG: hypothetical protein Kow0059_17220 [Candidatus Sumerlaeia bacterium]
MNHIFAWLIFLGVIVGVYTALSDPLEAEGARPTAPTEQKADSHGAAAAPSEAAPAATHTRWDVASEKGKKINDAIIEMPKTAVDILIGLIGPMALWLGIMRIAEEAGLIRLLALALQPILRPLFPRIPRGHPALGAMILNIAANMLGTGNAATPLGLKAMNELQKLNKEKDVATDAMIMFLAINTSSVTLIPFTTVAYRASAHSANPHSFLLPTILATLCSTTVAVIAASIWKRFSRPPEDYFDELNAAAQTAADASAIEAVYREHLEQSSDQSSAKGEKK